MSIIGRIMKGSVSIIANGLDLIIIKGTRTAADKYGKHNVIQTVADIGSGAVRGTETTVKILADVVDGGLETGAGYLLKDRNKRDLGVNRMKSAGKELAYTFSAGARTTASAYKAGKYYVKGSRKEADAEFAQTKVHARNFGKLMAVGLLTVGPVNIDDPPVERSGSGGNPIS